MESFNIQGLIHTYGTLLWVTIIALISLELLRALPKEEFGKHTNQWNVRLGLLAFIATCLTGSTGLFFLYEWEIWNSLMAVNFWWTHSMILAWILFSIVFFVLDPLLPEKLE